MQNNKARLVLEDGTVFDGYAAGSQTSTAGEVVFATGMVGYDLSLTDPSYAGQILTFTYPLIGNWGVLPKEYWESDKIQVAGIVVSDLTTKPSHWQSQKTLNDWLKEEGIPAIYEIDTRKLTQILRDRGTMLGKIIYDDQDIDFYDPNAENLVARVSPKTISIHRPEVRSMNQESRSKNLNSKFMIHNSINIGLLNCGAKRNIIRSLTSRGATVYDLPWNLDPFTSMHTPGVRKDKSRHTPGVNQVDLRLDGLIVSNGPGDPKIARESIAVIKKALKKKIPIFGICLGNQLLALAAGGDTYKLKFGHRAQNQPTIQVSEPERSRRAGSKRCYITTQNHGFAVSEKKLPKGFKRWFFNANDNTNEGIIHENLPFFSVQFHPEACPGPTDTEWLFDYFLERIQKDSTSRFRCLKNRPSRRV